MGLTLRLYYCILSKEELFGYGVLLYVFIGRDYTMYTLHKYCQQVTMLTANVQLNKLWHNNFLTAVPYTAARRGFGSAGLTGLETR